MHLSSTPQLHISNNFKIPHAPIDVDPEGTFHTSFFMQTFIWDYFGGNLILVSNSTRPPLFGWHESLSFKAKILKIKLIIFFSRYSYSLIFSLGLFYRIHPRIPSSSIPFFLKSLHHLQSERKGTSLYTTGTTTNSTKSGYLILSVQNLEYDIGHWVLWLQRIKLGPHLFHAKSKSGRTDIIEYEPCWRRHIIEGTITNF